MSYADYTLQELQALANQGDAEAQYELALMYAKGRGVPQDFTKAAGWYRKAAEQGDAKAQHNLGCCYELGKGVRKNLTKAVAWFRKAAEQGYADAETQRILGCCYY